jgi:hypothetical protein
MKNKHIIILFILGSVITILGSLLKITHMEFCFVTGTLLLTIGMLSQVIAGVLFIVKLFSNKNDSFLNK